MKNIAILVNTLKSGGSEKQSIFLLNALNKRHHVVFIVFHGEQVDEKLLHLIDGNNYDLIKLCGSFICKIFTLYTLFCRRNISHLFSYLTKPNTLGCLVGRLAGVRFIYGSIRSSQLPVWKFFIEKYLVSPFSTATIINNFSGALTFKKRGLNNIIVITNCLSKIDESIVRLKNEVVSIITIGRFTEAKDYKTAIRTVARLKSSNINFKFKIIGYGKLEHEIRNWVIEYDILNETLIYINPNNIAELLATSDIYLSTSLYEGTSNSIMEAMNSSLPIVATRVGDNDRMVHDNENGFLHDTGDFSSLSSSLELLALDYNLRSQFGIESNRILRDNYSYSLFSNKYLNLIGNNI